MDREFKQMSADEIAELAKVNAELARFKAIIAEHNRFCAESCRSRYIHDYCAYRRRDGSFIYGNKRCTDCPEHWIIEDS